MQQEPLAEKMWAWFAPVESLLENRKPTLAKRENSQRRRLLAASGVVGLGAALLGCVADLLAKVHPLISLLCFFLTALLLSASLHLNRRGRFLPASYLFLFGLILFCSSHLFTLPSSFASGCVVAYCIPIVASGFLLGRRAPFLFALLALGLTTAHRVFEYAILLHGQSSPGSMGGAFALLVILSFVLTAVAGLTQWGVASLEDAIARPSEKRTLEADSRLNQKNEAALEQASKLASMNGKLLEVQAELEAKYRALEAANAQLVTRATSDGMTGLANHRAFQEEMSRQLARLQRVNAPLALLLLDVDNFKKYNDSFGHPAGDDVLRGVAEVLLTVVREGDFSARYGGEEFAVILPDTDIKMAAHVAERIRAAVEARPFAHRQISVSIGVAQREEAETAAALIQRADVALYEAKTAGKNCVVSVLGKEEKTPFDHDPSPEFQGWHESWGQEAESRSEIAREDTAAWFTQEALQSLLHGGLEGLLQEPSTQILAELLSALDRRGAEPRGHCERVTRYTLRLGKEVADIYEEQRENRPLLPRLSVSDLAHFALGALLHDIGKVGIPDAILRKTGQLTDDEWRQIRRHPLAGVELVAGHPLLARALPVVRYHHERWDGAGYPQGLAGEAIPLGARLFAVCDTLEILTTDKPYRARLSYTEAREEIARGSGTQFDPDIIEAFLRIPEAEWQRLSAANAPLPDIMLQAEVSRAA